jgi:LPXTG-site transpeptidase (sortase) family protein
MAPSHANASHYIYGEHIGKLTVERLGRTINVIAGATDTAMDRGAGHFSFTGLNSGNTGLIGHNRGRTGYFSFVRELREGDIITLEAGGATRSYIVTMLYTIDESDFEPLMQFGDNRLTLITCVEYVPGQRRVAAAFESG